MGANFQVFLIAQVPTPEGAFIYQCVGAFNHHLCYGIRAVRALYRFFSLLRVRENAALVRDELRSFAEWNMREDAQLEPWMNPAVPCPFAVSLLSIAWTTDLEHLPYLSNYSPANGLLDARRDCWHRARQGVDQEGICVIDISDIERPAYCFVRRPGDEIKTAWCFLRNTYPSRFAMRLRSMMSDTGTEHERFMHALEAFWALVDVAGYPIISLFTVLQVWPDSVAVVPGTRQLQVPVSDDLPMPLDIVISLYLGIVDQALTASFARILGMVGVKPHVAVGKAILPPYGLGSAKDTFRRTFVIQAILSQRQPWEFVFNPPYLNGNGSSGPPYMTLSQGERVTHWFAEYARTVGSLSTCPLPPKSLEHLRVWGSQPAVRHLTSILSVGEFIITNAKLVLAMLASMDDDDVLYNRESEVNLNVLWFGLQELGDTTFLDLSSAELTPSLLIKLLNRVPDVECLSLSGNTRVRPEDLPAILTAAPSLRRLHVMHWTGPLFSDLQSVYSKHPELFRRLEGLMCPPLLACSHAAPPFISFAFHHNTRASIERSPFVSVPFFTPTQVVQTLTDTLPLAFQENRYGQSADLWLGDLSLAAQMGPNNFANPSHGVPFFMASPMFIHAAMSGGARRNGQSWNERSIVSVPAHGDTDLSQMQDGGTWVFHFDWDYSRHRLRNPGRNEWGFVRYEIVERCTTNPHGRRAGDSEESAVQDGGDDMTDEQVHHAASLCIFTPGVIDKRAHDTNYKAVVASEQALLKQMAAGYCAIIPNVGGRRRTRPATTTNSKPTRGLNTVGSLTLTAPSPAVPAAPPSQATSSPSTSASPPSGASTPRPAEQQWLRFAGTVYDLRGFLRCMADEGRELPDKEAIAHLERILETRDPETSELVCTLMASDEKLPLSGWRRTPSPAEREARFMKEYGGLGPDAFWTPHLFSARLARGAPHSNPQGLASQNYFLPMM